MVDCDTAEGCELFLSQVEQYGDNEHDPLTIRLRQEFGQHMRARADGGDVHPKLAELLEQIETINIDESCGEGWHRGSAYEKNRAPASSCAHLKQAVRRQGVFKRIRKFRKKYGTLGKDVVRYEFRNWKRILARRRTPWVAPRMTDKAAFGRIYREDASSEINWSTVVSRMDLHQIVPETADNSGAAQNEYLRSQVREGQHYGMDFPSDHASTSTALVPAEPQARNVQFRFLGSAHGHHRAHVMPTVGDQSDVSKTAALAWHVQFQERRMRGEGEDVLPPGSLEVFDSGDPMWVRPRDMAPFEDLQTKLTEYRHVEASPVEGCVVLSDPHLARPHHALMDKDCPVMVLIQQLKRKGWSSTDHQIVHTTTQLGEFDCVEATKFRTYFQCLWTLPTILPLTSAFPSRQPIAYYRLLLRGLRSEPYKQAKEYQVVLNADLRKRGEQIELPAIEDKPRHVGPGDDCIIHAGALNPETKARPKRHSAPGPPRGRIGQQGAGRGQSSGGGGSGSGPSVPPIVNAPGGSAGDPPPPPLPPPPGGPEEESEEDQIIVGSVAAVPPPKRRKLGREWKDGLFNAQISYKAYAQVEGGKAYRNYIIKCTHCPGTCSKTAGRVAKNMRKHGELEPLAFLHSWLEVEATEDKAHTLCDPSADAVDAFLANHEDELKDLFVVLTGEFV